MTFAESAEPRPRIFMTKEVEAVGGDREVVVLRPERGT